MADETRQETITVNPDEIGATPVHVRVERLEAAVRALATDSMNEDLGLVVDAILGGIIAPDQYTDIIEVFEGGDGWRYHGKSNNGEILYTSEPYSDKTEAVTAAGKAAEQAGISVEVKGDE